MVNLVKKVQKEKTIEQGELGFDDTKSAKPSAIRIEKITSAKHKSYLNSKNISPHLPMILTELFPRQIGGRDDLRHLPNDYARCSLFTARSRKEPRKVMVQEKLFHYNELVSVLYTGIELRAEDDEIVWLQIMNYGKAVPFGEPFEFLVKDIVSDLNWTKNGRNYDRVRRCISRLSATELLFNNTAAYGVSQKLSLISDYESVNDELGAINKYRVWVSPKLMLLFAGSSFTSHSWKIYRDLTPIARRLADYIGSHKRPFPLALAKFKEICGSNNKHDFNWRQKVAKACAELQSVELISTFRVKGDSINISREQGCQQIDGAVTVEVEIAQK